MNIVIDLIVTEARKHFYGSVRLTTGQLEVLVFADDLVMLVEAEEALLHNLLELNKYTLEKVNEGKLAEERVMRIGRKA